MLFARGNWIAAAPSEIECAWAISSNIAAFSITFFGAFE